MKSLFVKDVPWGRVIIFALVLGAVIAVGFFALSRWSVAEKPQEIGAAIRGDLDKLKGDLDKLKVEKEKEKSDREAAERRALEEREAQAKAAAEEKADAEAKARKEKEARDKAAARAAQLPPLLPFARVAYASKEEALNGLVTGAGLIISKEKLIERLKEIVGRRKGWGTGAEGEFTDAELLDLLRRDGVVTCVPFRKDEAEMDGLDRAQKARGVEEIKSFRRDSYPNECFLGLRVGDRLYRVMSLRCANTVNDHTGITVSKPAASPKPTATLVPAAEWTPLGPRVVVAPPVEEITVVRRRRVIVEEVAPPVQYVPVPQYVAAPMYAPPVVYAAPAYGVGGGGLSFNIASSRVNVTQAAAAAPQRSIAVNTLPIGGAGTVPRGIRVNTR